MATNANQPTPDANAPSKQKTVLEDMEARRVFDSIEDAGTYLANAMAQFSDFESYPVAAPGLSEDGEFDPNIYNESMQPAVAVLSQRGEGAGSSTVKAIVIYPSPRLDALMSHAEGRTWLEKIVQKELNHVAVRQLRKAENIADVVDQMPTTLEAYITSNRESSGGILQAFEDLWKGIKKALGSKFRAWNLQNLSKKEMRRAMESASYAKETYPTLEDRGDKPSLFVLAAQLGMSQAKKAGLDPAIFERFLATRDERVIDIETEDEEEFGLDDLEAAFTTGENEAPAADGEEQPAGESPAADVESNDKDGAAS